MPATVCLSFLPSPTTAETACSLKRVFWLRPLPPVRLTELSAAPTQDFTVAGFLV